VICHKRAMSNNILEMILALSEIFQGVTWLYSTNKLSGSGYGLLEVIVWITNGQFWQKFKICSAKKYGLRVVFRGLVWPVFFFQLSWWSGASPNISWSSLKLDWTVRNGFCVVQSSFETDWNCFSFFLFFSYIFFFFNY